VTIAGDSTGSFGNLSATGSAVRITSTGDVTATSIDAPIVAASGAGDMALGNVTSSTTALVQIETGSGDDSVTLNAVADKFLVDMGAGDDSVAAKSAAGSVINLGLGDDSLTPTAGASGFFGSAVGGGGTDTVILSNNGNYSTNGVWTEIEKIQLAGNVTLSEAQLDNDTTFQITGSNGVITATGVVSTNLSDVTFQSGNSSTFDITGHATSNSTLTGSDAADTLTGVAGDDTLKGGLGDDVLAGAAGNDVITGGAGDDTITGGDDNDNLTGGEGADTITGGAGNDTITLTEGTAAIDNVKLTAAATNGQDTITGFAAGAGADTITLVAADTSDGTTNGTATFGSASVALTNGAANWDGGANIDIDDHDVGEIATTLSANGDLDKAGVTDGTELLKALSSTSTSATGIKTNAAGGSESSSDQMYLVAYQGGKAFLYHAKDADADGVFQADEITLLVTFTDVADNAFASGDFLIP
jgi:Ca2+-binding RTX toxin-like protein